MSLFVKPDKEPLTEEGLSIRAARRRKLKHGAYATAVTCAFIAVVVLFNIAATVLADKFPLSLDLTTTGEYTIDEENAEFVKNLSREALDVQIIVCADESTYTKGEMDLNYYDPSSGKYFIQNGRLLKEYTRLNKAIHLKYIDPSDPDFNAYTALCPDETFIDGDLLLVVNFEMNGEEIERFRHFEMEDLFEISYDANDTMSYTYAQYGMMTLMSNNLETQVTSALASLTSDKVYQVAVVTHNGGTYPDELATLMKQNNYEFTEIENLNEMEDNALPEDADIVVIAEPMYDYTESELDLLDSYLDNEGKYGKTVFYIADAAQPDLPNLNEFLSEWGFSVMPGNWTVDTDESNQSYMGTYLFKLTEEENDYTGGLTDKDYLFYSTNDVPIQLKDPNGTRENQTLVSYADTSVALPVEAESLDESVADGPFVALGVSQVTPAVITDMTDVSRSYVVVCSSMSFIQFGSYSAKIGNLYAIMNTFDTIVGKTSTGITFDSRTFSTDSFETLPSTANVTVVTLIMVAIVLVPLITVAVVTYKKRRRRKSK